MPLVTPQSTRLTRGCLPLCALCCLVTSAIGASETTFSVLGSDSADRTLATVNRLGETRFECDNDLLESRHHQRALWLCGRDIGPDSFAQAVAHGLGVWWYVHADGGYHFTLSDHLPPTGALQVEQLTTAFDKDHAFADRIRTLMHPWLGDLAGLDYLPQADRWAATLDPRGRDQFHDLLGMLSRPAVQMPAGIPHPAQPLRQARLSEGLPAAEDWPSWCQALCRAGGQAVSIAPDLAEVTPPVEALPAQPLLNLPAALGDLGYGAAWISGVLCLSRLPPVDHRHPAQRLLRAMLRIPGWRVGEEDPVSAELVRSRLLQDVAPESWQQPGADILVWPRAGMLLVQADPAVLKQVASALRGWREPIR